MDISTITNLEANQYFTIFSTNRAINKDFYERIQEDKFNYRMVQTAERKSDSPGESLIHQIYVTRNYLYSVEVGRQEWTDERCSLLVKPEIKSYSKTQLLNELEKTEQELIALLSQPDIAEKAVNVLWAEQPIPAISFLAGLNAHEILHTGWNLAIMDHLGIERFDLLKKVWGK